MKKFTILFLMLFAFTTYLSAQDRGTTSTSIQDGNWLDVTTWDNGVPGVGDIAYVNHHVILNSSGLNGSNGMKGLYIASGASVIQDDISRIIVIAAGNTLEVSGVLNVDVVDFKANGVLTIDGILRAKVSLTAGNGFAATGEGIIYSGAYEGFTSIFGVPDANLDDGYAYTHYTWRGQTSAWGVASNWWDGVVPDATSHVIITDDGGPGNEPVIAAAGQDVKSIHIHPDASLDITTGNLTLHWATDRRFVVMSNADGDGSLIFDQGKLIDNATGVNAVGTVERYVTAGQWHQVSASTETTPNTSIFYDVDNDAWLLKYDETIGAVAPDYGWEYLTGTSDPLTAGRGWDYWVSTATTLDFIGKLYATDRNPAVTLTPTTGDGFNLLGNTFSSAIDWDYGTWGTIANNNSGSVYIWNGTGYDSWNGSAGSMGNGIIPMGQAFFVEASATGNVSIPEGARTHSLQDYYKSANDGEANQYVRIDLNGGEYGNTVFVGFPENGSDEFDFSGDATKLYSSHEMTQMFTIENEKELCINANTPLIAGESKTVPLNLVQVNDGDYTLSISDLDQLPDASIYLEDLKTGHTQYFRGNTTYAFTASSTDSPERFLLHFAFSPNGIGEGIAEAANINIYSSGKDIYVNSTDGAINSEGTIYVYDLMGREIAQQSIRSGELVKLTVNMHNAYAVVKVVKEGFVKTEKVFIK